MPQIAVCRELLNNSSQSVETLSFDSSFAKDVQLHSDRGVNEVACRWEKQGQGDEVRGGLEGLGPRKQ